MHSYVFNVTLPATLRIEARNEVDARRKLDLALGYSHMVVADDPATMAPLTVEVTFDIEGESELYEIDGLDPDEFSASQAAA